MKHIYIVSPSQLARLPIPSVSRQRLHATEIEMASTARQISCSRPELAGLRNRHGGPLSRLCNVSITPTWHVHPRRGIGSKWGIVLTAYQANTGQCTQEPLEHRDGCIKISASGAAVARTKTFATASDGTQNTCRAMPSGLLQLLSLSEFCKRRLDIV